MIERRENVDVLEITFNCINHLVAVPKIWGITTHLGSDKQKVGSDKIEAYLSIKLWITKLMSVRSC